MLSRPATERIADDRVRRIAHEGSATVQILLRHLRSSGLTFVPEPLLLDGDMEELSYLPGVCCQPTEERPADAWDDRHVARLGRALRQCHDASAVFLARYPAAPWFPFAEPCATPDVICHNDLGPWNVPITDTGLAIIDWEMASPGRRIQDVAQAAWNWVPFYPPAERATVGAPRDLDLDRRLLLLLEAYGHASWTKREILEEVSARQARLLELIAIAQTSRAVLLENWAGVDDRPILADQAFVHELLRTG